MDEFSMMSIMRRDIVAMWIGAIYDDFYEVWPDR